MAMIGKPKLEERAAQPYVGIRTSVTMQELPSVIPQAHVEIFGWLGKQGVAPTGAPFIRYYVIDMAGKLDIELGVPVASALSGTERISSHVLPAGRYASLIYVGVLNGIEGNRALLDWGAAQGLVWDKWDTEQGDAFGCRFESFLTDPKDEPDLAKWETEVVFRLADNQPK
jgi:effector-binding domain-containing protein